MFVPSALVPLNQTKIVLREHFKAVFFNLHRDKSGWELPPHSQDPLVMQIYLSLLLALLYVTTFKSQIPYHSALSTVLSLGGKKCVKNSGKGWNEKRTGFSYLQVVQEYFICTSMPGFLLPVTVGRGGRLFRIIRQLMSEMSRAISSRKFSDARNRILEYFQ